jgi:hypothetical protein
VTKVRAGWKGSGTDGDGWADSIGWSGPSGPAPIVISYAAQATGTSSGETPDLASYTPKLIGNALVFLSADYSGSASYYDLASVASANATWGTPQNYNPSDLSGVNLAVCLGTATSTSAGNVTATYGGATSSAQMAILEITGAPTWALGTIGTTQTTGASSITLPFEAASGTAELYIGLARSTGGIALTLITSGYTEADPTTNCHALVGPGPDPEYTFTAGNTAAAIAAILTGS